MTPTAELLPASIRDDRSLALAPLVDRIDDVDLTRLLVWRFSQVVPSALPHLAAGLDAPLMSRRPLSEPELRARVAASYELHEQYGSPAGLRRLAGLVDAEVLRIEEPPLKQFLGTAPSAAELAAFRALMPVLRLYRFRTRGTRAGRVFAGDMLARRFCHLSDAAARLGRRAELVDRGRVTALTTVELLASERRAVVEQSAEVRLPGSIGRQPAAGRFLTGLHLRASDAATRIYRVTTRADVTETDYRAALREARPSLEPLTVVPEQVATRGTIGHGAALDAAPRRMFLGFSSAGDRLYDQLWLHDPQRRPAARRNGLRLWCGYGRLGLPPRQAVLTVQVAGQPMPPRQRYVGGFATSAERGQADRRQLLEILNLGRPASARLLLTTTTRRPIRAGQAKAGEIKAGATTKATS